VYKSQNNFTAGEWSPFLDGRADLQKYDSACLTLQNFRPLPWGGATLRPGTEYVGQCKFANKPSRLIPFNYSTTLSYIIEAGDYYFRFWNSNGKPVNVTTAPAIAASTAYAIGAYTQDTGNNAVYYCILGFTTSGTPAQPSADPTHWVQQNIMEIPTVFPYQSLFSVQFRQLNDEMRMVNPSYPPQTLTFSGPTAWSIQPTQWKYPVLLDQNAVQSVVMAAGATSGSTTLTASAPAWVTDLYYPMYTAVENAGVIYTATSSFTSGASFAADLAAGLWAPAGIFQAGHVGSMWELQQLREAASELIDLNNQTVGVTAYSGTIEIEGDWTFTTSQFWWGDVQVQRSIDGGTTWTVIRDFQAASDQNYSTSGTENPPDIGFPPVLYRIAYTMSGAPFDSAIWTGVPPTQYAYANAALESEDAYIAGLFLVTGYVSATEVNVDVIIPPQDTTTSYLWSEGAFSDYRGYPQCIGFYEQRILYSGTLYLPNTVWGSVTSDFDNFQYSSDDDGALSFQPAVAQQNQACWLASLLRIHLGTAGEEIIMASGDLDEALTPSNVTMRAQSYYGSSAIQPMLLQNSILFVERNGLRVREMRELSPYIVPTDFIAPDLTLLSQHITEPGLVYMDFGRLPDPLAYFVRGDGVMPVMTYNREQNIVAWARYVTQGKFESVAVIYGAGADEVWVTVNRPFGDDGAPIRYIESFTNDFSEGNSSTIPLNCALDCAFSGYAVEPPQNSIGGFGYIAGQTVTAVVDGAEYAGIVVGDDGTVTLPPLVTGSTWTVGVPYTALLTPMKPEMQGQDGSSQGRQRRISEIVVRFRNTMTIDFGYDPEQAVWQTLQFRSPNDTVGQNSQYIAATTHPNGVIDVPLPGPFPGGNDFSGQFNIRVSHAFNATILGIFTKFEVLKD
jgi:hypothetical protein